MREHKVPLCDRHRLSRRLEQMSFSSKMVFRRASGVCGLYYGRQHGYFDLSGCMPHHQNKLTSQVGA
jgi:hypothetical protein